MSICMTCPMCHNVYGKFRAQCPACGNKTPASVMEPFNAPQDAISRALRAPRQAKPKKERTFTPAATACVFCRHRGAKLKCEGCGGLIHPGCRALHKDRCKWGKDEDADGHITRAEQALGVQ